jgi:hypothetical protein
MTTAIVFLTFAALAGGTIFLSYKIDKKKGE